VIEVRLEDLVGIEADALLRSVGSDLEACTPLDRRLGDRAGPEVLDRLRAFGETPVGAALVTPGGGLAAPFLIHLVLRSRDEPISPASLTRALRNGLRQSAEWGVGTLAVPPLGIGAGNLNAEASARVMCRVFREHWEAREHPRRILVAVGSPYEGEVFRAEAARGAGGRKVPDEPDEPELERGEGEGTPTAPEGSERPGGIDPEHPR